MEQAILDMSPKCGRCGRALHDDREIGDLIEGAIKTLKARNIYVPDAVYRDLKDVASEMWCRLGVCVRPT